MPTLGVFAVILDDEGRVLLVRQNYAKRRWTLPGGRVEERESIGEAAKREILEETGYHAEIGSVVGVYSAPYKSDVVVCVRAKILSVSDHVPNPGEIAERRFFMPDALPEPISPKARLRIRHAVAGERGMLCAAGDEDAEGDAEADFQ